MAPLLQRLLLAVLLLLTLQNAPQSDARMMSKAELRAKQHTAAERFALPPSISSQVSAKNFTFTNPKASGTFEGHLIYDSTITSPTEFYVDGTSIPEVDFDIGPSWSGLLPISNSPNETRKVREYLCYYMLPY